MKNKYPFVYIEWMDASSLVGAWKSEREILEWAEDPPVSCQAGYLLQEGKDFILLASIYAEKTNKYGSVFRIPKTWIKKRKDLDIT